MRIISGKLGGQNINSPRGHKTHPMNEKGRGALFNALGDIEGLTILDAFAGSGAIGLEALSRGASYAMLIDDSKQAQLAIADNIRSLSLDNRAKLIKASAGAWLKTSNDFFDLVVLDPPFEKLQKNLMNDLAQRTKVGGLVIFSLPPMESVELNDSFNQVLNKKYGDNQLVFYRRIK